MQHTICGTVSTWALFNNSRTFLTVTVPFEIACDIFKSALYDGKTGLGEQREVFGPHSRKLQREMRDGNYTPTPISVGVYPCHVTNITIDGKSVELVADSANPLPMTDGSHRFDALKCILASLLSRQSTTEQNSERELLTSQIEQLYQLPIVATIHLSGDPQVDFMNLQAGRSVDTSHLLTMKIRRNLGGTPEIATAFEIAKVLASAETGPYAGQIRFDSRGSMPLPISTLCTKGSSDLSTSLVGLAKVIRGSKITVASASKIVELLFSKLRTECPQVLEYGKVLTPIGNSGTKGSATMMIGVAICIAHDMIMRGSDKPRLDDAVLAAVRSLDRLTQGSFSAGNKRDLMGGFASAFFETSAVEKHEGVPVTLMRVLSATAYSCSQLAKTQKPDTQEKAVEVTETPKKPRGRPRTKAVKEPQPEPQTPDIQVAKDLEMSHEPAPWEATVEMA